LVVTKKFDSIRSLILDELPYYEGRTGKRDSYGQCYDVIFPITGPNGETAGVLTAWIIESGEDYPRFVTAIVQ
jgi:hypothetical protein